MYAAGHTEVVESLSTMIETIGEDALTTEGTGTANWNPGIFCLNQPRSTYIEFGASDLVQKCLTMLESHGDTAVKSRDLKRGILQYSTALSLNPPNHVDLLVKQSNARTMLGFWEEALKDADEVSFCSSGYLTNLNSTTDVGYQGRSSQSVWAREKACGLARFAAL